MRLEDAQAVLLLVSISDLLLGVAFASVDVSLSGCVLAFALLISNRNRMADSKSKTFHD